MVAPGPSFSVADVQRGWERALTNLGHEVRTYNLDDRLSFFGAARFSDGEHTLEQTLEPEEVVRLAVEPLGNACYRYWPDVIIVVSGFFVPNDLWEVWKHRPHKTVLLCTESPYEDDRQFDQAIICEPDVVLLNDPTNMHAFRAHRDNVWYAPHAYDPEIHSPGPSVPEYECDFSFVGTGYSSRRDLFARVDWHGIDAKLAGMWTSVAGTCLEPFLIHPLKECFDNTDTVQLYRSSKASANLYRGGSDNEANDPRLREGWSVGPREIELAATRTFFLREPRPEGDELFPFLPRFEEPEEFEEMLRYFLTHDHVREELAQRAYDAIRDRTFDAHARRLMQILPD